MGTIFWMVLVASVVLLSAALVYAVYLPFIGVLRLIFTVLLKVFYRIRVEGLENIPATGGAILTPNHVSWLDGLLVPYFSPRPPRMVVWVGNFQKGWLQRFARRGRAIMLSASNPKSIVRALQEAREAALQGELVCIFPEGGITRTGITGSFHRGVMKIVEGTDIPVVPVYLDGLWGSLFSFSQGKFFRKRPGRIPYAISIAFGRPLTAPRDEFEIRQAVQALGAQSVSERQTPRQITTIPEKFIRFYKRWKYRSRAADSSGVDYTGGQMLMRSLILRRLLRRHVLAEGEQNVGILIPPSVAGVVANVALTMDRRTVANLSYAVTSEIMNKCIRAAGLRHVITSRKVMERFNLQIDAELVYLEDFQDKVTLADKLIGLIGSYLVPARWLIAHLKLRAVSVDDTVSLLFTSGSTGDPKGVMLTHRNIVSNCASVKQCVVITPDDVLLGILPFFHSFGATVSLWGGALLEAKVVYHFNPLDFKQVGKVCKKHACTIVALTPTLLRNYMRRCGKEELGTLEFVITGAEKLPRDLIDAYREKFGIEPVEGYGTTELSPFVSCGVPAARSPDGTAANLKHGTIGRPLSGIAVKIVDLDTGETLGPNRPGMLYVSGPNVMKGYLDMPEKTAEVLQDGWYRTGDVAMLDDDGFIVITGRESRFSKIGGEMIPHIQIEEALLKIVAEAQPEGEEEEGQPAQSLGVTSVPHPKKGERLVVLHTRLPISPDQMCEELKKMGLPNLFIPSPDSFVELPEMPLLGIGKLDLRRAKQIALEHFPAGEGEEDAKE